jgi:hypothetical protein
VLLAPFKEELVSAKSLIIIPDEAILRVPFAALVTDNTSDAYAALAQGYT